MFLQSSGVADVSSKANIAKILDKFPSETRPPMAAPPPHPVNLVGTVDDLRGYLNRLFKGAAPSISGWTTDHIRDIVESSEEAIVKIRDICDYIARGEVK
jgi:hypothetical protein